MSATKTLSLSRPIEVIQGEDRTIGLTIMKDSDEFEPYDLTGVTEISVLFIKRDASTLERTLSGAGGVTVVAATAGRIAVALTAAQTADLKVSNNQSFEIAITIASKIRKVQVLGRLNVIGELEC